jgi:lysozyme family protein
MAQSPFTPSPARAREHERLFNTLVVRPGRLDDVQRILDKMLAGKQVYQSIMQKTTVP